MEDVLKQALPEVPKPEEVALPLPPVEPEGGGVRVGSIGAILIAADAIYIVGRIFCKK